MRIALVAAGSRGDTQPLLALGADLRAAGHDAWLVAPPDFAALARRQGVPHRAWGRSAEAQLGEVAHATVAGAAAVLEAFHRMLDEQLETQFRELPDALDGADAVLGGGLALAAFSIAEARGVPCLQLAYVPTMLQSAHWNPMMLPDAWLPGAVRRGLWWAHNRFYHRVVGGRLAPYRARLGLQAIDDLYTHWLGRGVLLAADEALAPLAPDVRERVLRTGHRTPAAVTELAPALRRFLESPGDPVVYAGFGSMTDPEPAYTTALLGEAAQRASVRLVLGAGWAKLGESGVDPSRVFVVQDVSHEALFARVRGVVHHGGAGTVHTAARAGVAQWVVVHLMDQSYWGARTAALGVGPAAIKRSALSLERLARGLARLVNRAEYTEQARALRERMTGPMDAGAVAEALARWDAKPA